MSNIRQAPPAPAARGGSAGKRLIAIAVAAVVVVVIWLIARALDVSLSVDTGADSPLEVGVGAVIVATVVAGLLGWALLALLERLTAAGRTIWTVIAVVVLLLSLLGPVGGVSTGAKVTLALMHLAAGAVIIPAFRSSSRQR